MNDQKQLMNIFAQAYQLIAKASKQQPSQEGFQQILEMLGEEGIKECAKVADQGPEAVAQAMVQIIQQKQTQKAANGAKLRYIMQLQGKCQPGYLKKGGRCKPCEKAEGVFRNKADIFYEGGYISGYRNSQNNLKKKVQEDAMTRTEGVPLNGKVYGTERWPIRINPGITVNSKVGNKAGKSSLSISDYRKQNQRLKERLYQEDRTRTEGVRDKDGKLRGTERYPYKLPELTVTNKTTKKKQDGGPLLSKVSTKLPTKLIRDKEYPIYNYDGSIASYSTDDNARELSGHLPYNPSKYTRVEPYDGITTRAFDVAMSNYKNPTFKDRLNVLGQYLKNPKGFKQYHYIDYQKNYQNK